MYTIKPGAEIFLMDDISKSLILPTKEDWQTVSSKMARIKQEDANSPWNPFMADRIDRWLHGHSTDLAQGYLVRVNCSAILFDKKRGLLQIQLDNVSTTPNEWGVPSSVWETGPIGVEGIIKQALLALGQKVIITKGHGTSSFVVGFWEYQGELVAKDDVCMFAARYLEGASIDPAFRIKIDRDVCIDNGVFVSFADDDAEEEFVVSFAVNTGALGLGIPFKADIEEGVLLLDGESWAKRIEFFKFNTASQVAITALGSQLTAS
ncbi:hypothetical protein L6252_01045 [Candidatus Parcubacteria bacterium]|nr:hypothetical protein [Candidatus Parcubacteria bacterium]